MVNTASSNIGILRAGELPVSIAFALRKLYTARENDTYLHLEVAMHILHGTIFTPVQFYCLLEQWRHSSPSAEDTEEKRALRESERRHKAKSDLLAELEEKRSKRGQIKQRRLNLNTMQSITTTMQSLTTRRAERKKKIAHMMHAAARLSQMEQDPGNHSEPDHC